MCSITYQFPEQSFIQGTDVSGIRVDLDDIYRGGIGYGGSGSKRLAQGMEMIGNSKSVINLPFCIEGTVYPDFKDIRLVNIKNAFEETFPQILENGKSYNLPINLNGHTSLLHIAYDKEKPQVYFFDSTDLGKDASKERYDVVSEFVKDYLGITFTDYRVYHILDQGDPKETSGCGYYTLFTALLLKDATAEKLFARSENGTKYLFSSKDDLRIRCECVIRAILHQRLRQEELDICKFQYGTSIAHMIGFHPLVNAIQQIQEKKLGSQYV